MNESRTYQAEWEVSELAVANMKPYEIVFRIFPLTKKGRRDKRFRRHSFAPFRIRLNDMVNCLSFEELLDKVPEHYLRDYAMYHPTYHNVLPYPGRKEVAEGYPIARDYVLEYHS